MERECWSNKSYLDLPMCIKNHKENQEIVTIKIRIVVASGGLEFRRDSSTWFLLVFIPNPKCVGTEE